MLPSGFIQDATIIYHFLYNVHASHPPTEHHNKGNKALNYMTTPDFKYYAEFGLHSGQLIVCVLGI